MELTKKALLAIKKKHRKVKLLRSHEEDLPTCHEGHQRSSPANLHTGDTSTLYLHPNEGDKAT